MTATLTLRRGVLVLWLVMIAGTATAQDPGHPVSMWKIEGSSNRIYLLGSVHVLRAEDHPVPMAIENAYRDAEVLIMEVDMDDLDQFQMASDVNELGRIDDGGSLEDYMGPELYAEAAGYASQLNIPIEMLAQSEPWLAAITVEQMTLLRIGFNPEYGIEFHLMTKAGADDKEILGFETARQQLEILDALSIPAQRSLLIETLKESLNMREELELLIDAWRHGDTGFIEKNLLAEMQRYPELYQSLVVARNRAWVERITELTAEKQDYLVVVGALHLVGEDGIPALLSDIGINADQVREPGS